MEAIAGLVTPQVPPQQLPEFFWVHLEKDLELLGRDTGKGLDETVMIVHLVLRQILTTNPPIGLCFILCVILHGRDYGFVFGISGGTIQTVSSLDTKEARKEWESVFNQHYIQPVLSTLDENLTIAMDFVANDKEQGLMLTCATIVVHLEGTIHPHVDHDKLFYLVYEKMKCAEGSLEPHLWTYRSRITLEHLQQTLQEKRMKEKYPILHEFLQAVS